MIVSSMNMTPPRAQKVLFSNMYYATAPVWVGQGQQQERRHDDGLR